MSLQTSLPNAADDLARRELADEADERESRRQCAYAPLSPEWIIGVCEDGTFDVSQSDCELTDRKDCFSTLDAAKDFCQQAEASLSANYLKGVR